MLKIRKSKAVPSICPVGECMAFLGVAWAPQVIWQLSGGPRRFSELRMDIGGVTPKMLSARLRDLELLGVIVREVMPTSPPSVEYTLSDLGVELLPAITAIVNVGYRLKERAAQSAQARAAGA